MNKQQHQTILATAAIIFIAMQFCTAQDTQFPKGTEKAAPWFVQKFRLSAGTFFPINNTNIQVTKADGGTGTDIDWENDLGFKKVIWTFIMDFQYRISRRSRLDFRYYAYKRSSTKTISKDIVFGNHTFTRSASVAAFFNTDLWWVSYGYSILQKPKFELGALIGAHIVNMRLGLSAEGNLIGDFDKKDTLSINQAIPDLGIWGGYTFNERFAVHGEFNYLSATISDFKGGIAGGSISFLYHTANHLDLSLGYNGFNFRLDKNAVDKISGIRWNNNGPSLTAVFSFGKKYGQPTN